MSIRQWKEGVTVDQADWRLGADSAALTASARVGPIRSMSDPNSVRNQPAHMTQFKVMKQDDEHDWGGVHTNSGIPNRAFYGAAIRIGGYVWDKSAKIWYLALRDYLQPNATFADAARATVHVAGELYGEGSREQGAVIAGWKDVGIRVNPNDPAPTPRQDNAGAKADASSIDSRKGGTSPASP
jgi:Zn-dependent metalloprotease